MYDSLDSGGYTTCDIAYAEGFCCRIRAPATSLRRVLASVERHSSSPPRARISVVQASNIVDFPPDSDEPYLRIQRNTERRSTGVDHFRYGILARSVWRPTNRAFLIRSHVHDDETSILECFRDLYFLDPVSTSLALVHASLVKIGDAGLLIVGSCRAGKTTLVVRLLSVLPSATFVADGLCLVGNTSLGLIGQYLPRRIYIRFATLFDCERLSNLGYHVEDCMATQILDLSTIQRIMNIRNREVDLSLTMARSRFVEAMGAISSSSARITHVVLTAYHDSPSVSISPLASSAIYALVGQHEFPRELRFGRIERQRDVHPPSCSAIGSQWFRGVSGVRLQYEGWSQLSRTALDDLLAQLRVD